MSELLLSFNDKSIRICLIYYLCSSFILGICCLGGRERGKFRAKDQQSQTRGGIYKEQSIARENKEKVASTLLDLSSPEIICLFLLLLFPISISDLSVETLRDLQENNERLARNLRQRDESEFHVICLLCN
jgi:hypothetical protein